MAFGWMARTTLMATVALAAWSATVSEDAVAQEIVCGDFYEIVPGDTLREIALNAYGTGDFDPIFEANRDVIPRPSLLLVGQRILIPCLDDDTAEAEEAAPTASVAAVRREILPFLPEPVTAEPTVAEPSPTEPAEAEDVAEAVAAAPRGPVGTTEVLPRLPVGNPASNSASTAQAAPTEARTGVVVESAAPQQQAPVAVTTTESLPVPPPGAATPAPTPEPVPTQAEAEETQPEQRAAEPVVAEPQNAEPAESIVVAVAEPAAEEPQTTFSLPGSTGRLEARAPSQPRQQPSPVQPLPSLSGLRAPEPPASEPEPAEDIEVAAVTPQASARTSAARRPETTPRADLVIDYGNQNAASVQPRIRVLTGEFAPYTGRTLPESGMLADIMVEAIAASAPGRGLRMTFADEWEAHLDTLLPESRYDIGFPWFRPNCDAPERLSAEMRRRCSDFVWSQPLHEVVVGVFVRAGDPLTRVSEYAALSGRSLCRPEGFQTLDLFQKGVVPASVRRVEAVDAKACMRQLVAGQVDAVALDIVKAEGVLGELGLFNAVAEAPALADIITLHAIAPRSNPFGRTYVTLLDRGLRDLRDSGAWFDIVARHLAGQF